MKIDILKCHGSGNDFILIDELSKNYGFTEEDRVQIAIRLCDRKKSIGADGILFVVKSENCHARMRIFNADGTEPEMCGNGIRCVGRYVLELLHKDSVNIETMKAEYNIVKKPEIYDGVKTVQVSIETVDLRVESLPMIYSKDTLFFDKVPLLDHDLLFSGVSITNPHIISVVEHIDTDKLVQIGSRVNSIRELFPKGANFSFLKVIDKNNLFVKTFERGVGLTKSCGTAMISSCVVSAKSNKINLGEEVNVYNEGGMIKCAVRKNNNNFSVNFMGNASYVFRSAADYSDGICSCDKYNKVYFEDEIASYDKFLAWTKQYVKDVL